MSAKSGYDELEFERLYTKLLHQKTGAFFCVIANSVAVQREIAENICGRFSGGEVQVVDFGKVGGGFKFSSAALRGLIRDDSRFLFLVNFQLACGDLSDIDFLQVLNLSRDSLAELPHVFVFMMPLYFRITLARNAPDFNSFFRYRAEFSSEVVSPNQLKGLDSPHEGFSLANKSLLEYYVEKYGELSDKESKAAFETVLKILDLNTSLRVLHFAELNRFFGEFVRLLQKYEGELEDAAFDIAKVFFGQGDYDEALGWYHKALANREKVMGAEHPDIATTYNNIAFIYFELGEFAKARDLFCRAVIVWTACNLANHPDTEIAYDYMRRCYDKAGGEAENFENWYKDRIENYPNWVKSD